MFEKVCQTSQVLQRLLIHNLAASISCVLELIIVLLDLLLILY
jgi:hypothetical protein